MAFFSQNYRINFESFLKRGRLNVYCKFCPMIGYCRMKTAGIIIIGDEVLKGQVADQNLFFLAPKLHNLGIKLRKVSIIPDCIEEIAKEVSDFSSKFDTVITTGGVGPTHDDVTYEGVAAAFGEPLVLNHDIVKFWSNFTKDPEAKKTSTKKFATVPKSSVILYPEVSSNLISKGKFPVVTVKNVLICPGVPKFLAGIFTALEGSYFNSFGVIFYNKAIYLRTTEEKITDVLNETVAQFPTVQFGSYPKFGNEYYRVILTLESEDESALDKAFTFLSSKLNPDWIVQDGDLLANAYRHTMDLLESGNLGNFKEILKKSINVVDKCLDDYKVHQVFISFNGGKDCTALLHLIHSILVKRHGERHYPKLTGVYFKQENSFKEVEDFIFEAAARYNLNLIVHEGKIKDGLSALLKKEGKKWKACLMGVRRQDPNCSNLNPFQATDEGWPPLMRVSPMLDWSYADVWTYLRGLSVPYCPLYDRGDRLSTNKNPLSAFRTAASELSNLLSPSLGPTGLAILINSSGKFEITRAGIEITSAFGTRNLPPLTYLLNSCENLEKYVGDGTKSFVIMLSSLLALSESLDLSLLSQFRELYKILSRNYSNFSGDTKQQDLVIVSQSFFASRFPPHISKVFGDLFNIWVEKNSYRKIPCVYDYLYKNFDTLVILKEGNSPLSDSKTVEGVHMTGNFHGTFPNLNEKYLLYCIYLSKENDDDESYINSHTEELLPELTDLKTNDILIITNCHLPFSSLQLLYKYKLLTHAKCETVNLIYEFVVLHKKENSSYPLVQFSVPNLLRKELFLNVPIHSLLLSAPGASLSLSYSKAVQGCLRLCRFATDSKSIVIKCRQFEKLLSMYLAATFGDEWFLPVIPSSLLVEWYETVNKIKNNAPCLDLSNDSIELNSFLQNLMKSLKESTVQFDQEVILILCQTLLEFHLKFSDVSSDGYEPLMLKYEIILRVLQTFCSVMNIDQTVSITSYLKEK